MKNPIRKTLIALFLLELTQSASAVPTTILDGYTGGSDHGYGDVIGTAGDFGISGMDVEVVGNILSVTINTGFGGKGDNGLFAPYTDTVYGLKKGIGYGDLFLSTSWTPAGDASTQYITDNNENGTVWSYGFSLNDRWMSETKKGSGALYSLNSGNESITGPGRNPNALTSDDFLSGATYRNGQEVAVDLNSDVTQINTGTWSTTAGSVSFLIDLTGTALASSKTIALHWGMTCGNDVIEGAYTRDVPAPGILLLTLTGLAGITLTRRRKGIQH